MVTLFTFWGIDKLFPKASAPFYIPISSVCMYVFVSPSVVCPTLCDPMDCSTPGFPVLHHLPEFDQTPVHWVGDAIQPSHPGSVPFSSYFQSFPASESFPVSQLFTSGGQSIGASASTSVLPIHIQDWFPLGLTGLISLLSKGISNVFSNTTVRKHQFFGTQTSLWSNSDPIMYIRTRSPNSPHSCWHLL